ncbi:MAG: EAL domain-containing protein [Alphaproteobacteria bacterium]|nr:EAL domain-containing protein [Alphaproteobacteria bacterium]
MDFLRFLDGSLDPGLAFPGSYDPFLVILSYLVAALASFSALELAERVRAAPQRRTTALWLASGSLAMGSGVWSMHFIGMLAFSLPVAVRYDLPLTLLSMIPAIFASAVALHMIEQERVSWRGLLVGGALMGAGIGTMHYTGMAAMRMDAATFYDPLLFTMSLVIAVLLATIALSIKHWALVIGDIRKRRVQIASALVMGLAIVGMHYTAMAAAFFFPSEVADADIAVIEPLWLGVWIGGIVVLILTLATSAAIIGQRLALLSRLEKEIKERQQADESARLSREQISRILESTHDIVFAVDQDWRIVYANHHAEAFFGERADLLAKGALWDKVPELASFFYKKLTQAMSCEKAVIFEGFYPPKSLWFDARAFPTPDGLAIYLLDITQSKQAEEILRESEMLFRTMTDGAPAMLWMTDTSGKSIFFNQAWLDFIGRKREETFAETWVEHLHPDDRQRCLETVDDAFSTHHPFEMEYRLKCKDGEYHWFYDRGKPRFRSDNVFDGFIGVATDITEQKEAEQRILHQDTHDTLTGLPNQALLLDRLHQATANSTRQETVVALLIISLDQFKKVNDNLGRKAGDQLLLKIGPRLRTVMRETDTVTRLGGDEFAVIIPDLDSTHVVESTSRRILRELAAPFLIGGTEIFISASIGIAFFPSDAEEVETLLLNANSAMRQAKKSGGNTSRYYTARMNVEAAEHLHMEEHLHHALERKELAMHYQPIIDFKTGTVKGAEALMRWTHPSLGIIPPDKFIPLAEETGLIESMGRWGLHTACKQLRAWRDQDLGEFYMAVNLSVRQCRDISFWDMIEEGLSAAGLDHASLTLEITESLFIDSGNEKMMTALQDLRKKGVSLSVDDFGTGYSSLGYLRRFPIDILKIDRSFVENVANNPEDKALVEAIIAMARSLNLKVVAEGLETQEQMKILQDLNCDLAQGFLISKPMPADEFVAFLQDHKSPARGLGAV